MKPLYLAVIVSINVIAGTGCQHHPPATFFQFVETAHTEATDGAKEIHIEVTRKVFIDAIPIGPLALPSFPQRAKTAHLGNVSIVMRISVAADGQVEGSERSVADFGTPTPFDADFVEAIHAALARWRFEPAQLALIEPQSDGTSVVISSTDAATAFDVTFTFSPSGQVGSDVTHPRQTRR